MYGLKEIFGIGSFCGTLVNLFLINPIGLRRRVDNGQISDSFGMLLSASSYAMGMAQIELTRTLMQEDDLVTQVLIGGTLAVTHAITTQYARSLNGSSQEHAGHNQISRRPRQAPN